MNIVFFDTETTGIGEPDRLCQIAWKLGDELKVELFKPPLPVPAEAMAVHHITNKILADRPSFQESTEWSAIKDLFEHADTIPVAHNAKFDLDMLKKENIIPKRHICTLRVVRALDTNNKFSNYKLQYLRYALDIDIEGVAHSADGDVMVLEKLFERLLKKLTETEGSEEKAIAKMIEISNSPSIMKSFNFGKYVGKTVEEVTRTDRGYLEWLLKSKLENSPDDEDWIYTLRKHLGK